MGMDVYGRKPNTAEGESFHCSVWAWRPLAAYACAVAPDITSKCKHWQTNDCDGLNYADSVALAGKLQAEIDSGRTGEYETTRRIKIAEMPDEACDLCNGTGTRKPIPLRGAGDPNTTGIKCNSCDGSGRVRPDVESYPFKASFVQKFATFLRGSGGFKIC